MKSRKCKLLTILTLYKKKKQEVSQSFRVAAGKKFVVGRNYRYTYNIKGKFVLYLNCN